MLKSVNASYMGYHKAQRVHSTSLPELLIHIWKGIEISAGGRTLKTGFFAENLNIHKKHILRLPLLDHFMQITTWWQ
jgi:hypothetical protein